LWWTKSNCSEGAAAVAAEQGVGVCDGADRRGSGFGAAGTGWGGAAVGVEGTKPIWGEVVWGERGREGGIEGRRVEFDGRGGGWGGFELLEGVEGAVEGAAGGIDAPLELAEGLVFLHAGLAEGKIVFLAVGFLVGIFKELGFGDAEAAEGPLATDEVVEQDAGFGGGGVVAVVVLGGELLEVGEVLGREDEGFGVDAGFEGVHGGDGLACDRVGASGFLGVTAVSFYLTESGHVWLAGCPSFARMDRDPEGTPACPTLRIEERFQRFGNQSL